MKELKSLVYVLFILLSCLNLYSQGKVDPLTAVYDYKDNKPLFLKLKATKYDNISFPFYIDRVIDSTDNKIIGYTRKGIFNVRRPLCLRGGTKDAIENYIYQINKARGGFIPLHIVISKVSILEDLNTFNAKTNVIVTMKFYSLGSLLYTVSSSEWHTYLDGTKMHDNNLKKAIKNCLTSFSDFYQKPI